MGPLPQGKRSMSPIIKILGGEMEKEIVIRPCHSIAGRASHLLYATNKFMIYLV